MACPVYIYTYIYIYIVVAIYIYIYIYSYACIQSKHVMLPFVIGTMCQVLVTWSTCVHSSLILMVAGNANITVVIYGVLLIPFLS